MEAINELRSFIAIDRATLDRSSDRRAITATDPVTVKCLIPKREAFRENKHFTLR